MAELPIPFEKQAANDRCGAAALCMVYRSFGGECSQAGVWEKVSRGRRIRTQLLAADAIERGYFALILKAAQPWQLLQRCRAHGIHPILNHRIDASNSSGHYSVVVEVGED